MDTDKQDQLDELLNAFVDGSLTEEQNRDLEALLQKNPEAKKRFVRFIDQHRSIQEFSSASARINIPDTISGKQFSMRSLAAAAAVIFVAGILMFTLMDRDETLPLEWSSSTDSVTVDRSGPNKGKSGLFPGDTVSVGKGSGAMFTYPDGTSVTLLPETDIEVLETGTEKSLKLKNGTLSVVASKQPEDHPMKVFTDQAEISVVGTVFNVRVSSGITGINVVEGKICVDLPRGGKEQIVSEGEQASVSADGTILVSADNASEFKGFINGSMSKGTEVPLGWNEPYIGVMNKDKGLVTVRDRNVYVKSPASVRLSTTKGPADGNTYQLLKGAPGKKLRISGFVRHKGTGKRYWSIAVHSFTDKSKPRDNLLWEVLVQGVSDTDWTYFEGDVSIPADAGETFLRIFMRGEGATWLDEVKVKEIR